MRPRLRPLPYQRQLLLWGIPAVLTLLGIAVLGLGPAGSVLLGVFLFSFAAVIRDRPSPKHFGPLLLVWGLAMLMLIVIRDLGSSLMFFGGFLGLLWVATARLSLIGVGSTMFFGGAFYLSQNVAHVKERVDIWLDPFARGVVNDEGYQLAQSLFAQADGGLFGQGFGQALLELPGGGTILPAAHTDLIYAVLTNEAGLFGAAGLIGVYLLLVYRGLRTALSAGDGFSKLLATGPHGGARDPGVRDRGRRHARDPADRRDAAVRLLRRQLDRGEHGAAGAAPDRLRPRPRGRAPARRAGLAP